jgi:catechol 2,3-dioxygenase-like lactoylglutathione lyase family enzyme
MQLGPVIPILRIFDEEKAREFYEGFLGFRFDWLHRFEPGTPLYAQVSRGEARLHLSEHYGDASPGSAVRIEVAGIEAYHADLTEKRYKYYRPGIETMPWGNREMKIIDPFFNRIIFVALEEKG